MLWDLQTCRNKRLNNQLSLIFVSREFFFLSPKLWMSVSFHPSCPPASGQSDRSSMVVAGYNVSAPAGSKVVLQCMSGRMVWTRDRVRDRQRVVHWDLFRDHPDYAMERVLDMFSAGDQRIYNSYNTGRVGLSPKAFKDGNFSLVIKGP